MPPNRKPLREIPFSAIEARFTVASYTFFGRFSPAVIRVTEKDRKALKDGYQIRIRTACTEHANGEVTEKFDYFTLTGDGEVLSAPRGWTKDYKPARVTGLDEAVAKYAEPAAVASTGEDA